MDDEDAVALKEAGYGDFTDIVRAEAETFVEEAPFPPQKAATIGIEAREYYEDIVYLRDLYQDSDRLESFPADLNGMQSQSPMRPQQDETEDIPSAKEMRQWMFWLYANDWEDAALRLQAELDAYYDYSMSKSITAL
ncbi:hypothetical protein [Halomicrococcus gelatinilyticus]|uniref:hypothetical protein n=1 Tax=Halomicrococcus gelatinilyticus TaxID=1702103 RepID=UPI002E136F22